MQISEYRLSLRHLQEEAIRPLLIVACAAGLGVILLAHRLPNVWLGGLLGLLLIISSLSAYMLLGRGYLASASLVLVSWLVTVGASTLWQPGMPAGVLMALPVGFAALFIDLRVGFLTGLLVNLAFLTAERLVWGATSGGGCETVSIVIWGVFLLSWISQRPTQTAIQWSWESYDEARRQLQSARDRQAELKQAVKHLADANMKAARLNQLLSAARKAAEEAEQVKVDFVANVSHELRTPLSMIIGFSEMILDSPTAYGDRLPPALMADVAAIKRNAEHLAGLVNDVLDLSQLEAQRMTLRKQWTSLAAVAGEATLAVKPLLDSRGLFFRVDVSPDLPKVHCDRTRVRQVLLNLLNNAARFTETGGVGVEASSDEQRILVTVSDTGPGIAEAHLPTLFQRFHPLGSRAEGGAGLGLHISRAFIDLHGGQMGVRSELGVGSSFWFTLPLNPRSSGSANSAPWLNAEWALGRRLGLPPRPQPVPGILVLEAQDALENSVRRYVDDVDVRAAPTPERAQLMLAEEPAQTLLIRGESEEETAAWVKQMRDTPDSPPVVACTIPTPRATDRLHIAAYLVKPIRRSQLLEAIGALNKPVCSILLVDDDPETLQLFTRMLSSGPERFLILQASTGTEALQFLRSRHPDLMVLDLVMSGMDGFMVLAEKNGDRRLRSIPVIIVSARDVNGQPIAAPSLIATRSGGLSMSDLVRCALTLGEILWTPRAVPRESPKKSSTSDWFEEESCGSQGQGESALW